MRVFNELFFWNFVTVFNSDFLLVLFVFLLVSQLWPLNNVLRVVPPLPRNYRELRDHGSSDEFVLGYLEADFNDLVADAAHDSSGVCIEELGRHLLHALVALKEDVGDDVGTLLHLKVRNHVVVKLGNHSFG